MLLLAYLLLVTVKYTFTIYYTGGFYNFVQIFTPMLGSFVFFLVCYYFTIKASDLIGDDERTVRSL